MGNGHIIIVDAGSHPLFAGAIAHYVDVELMKPEMVTFSNGNHMATVPKNVRGADVFVIQTQAPPVDTHIVQLMLILDALKSASAAQITAVLPYMPYVRSDKKDRPRISIAARLMARQIEAAGATGALMMDLHAPQIQGFFECRADHLKAAKVICAELRLRDLSNAILVAADVGEAKEVGPYANRLGLPIAIIDKRREGDQEKAIPTHLVGDVNGKDTIIIDDEISTGGTLVEAAEFLKAKGAKSVIAAATHPVLSGHAVKRLNACAIITELIVTDTIPTEGKVIEKMRVLSVAPMFGEAIRRIHTGESVSRVFAD